MSKKIAPLNDDLIMAQVTFLTMIDDLEQGVDLIEACKNAHQRDKAIADLRMMIAEVRQAHRLTSDISYMSTYAKGQKSLSQQARNVKLVPSKMLDKYLEENWFSLDKKPRQDAFVKQHYPLFCKLLEDEYKSKEDDGKKFKNPISQNQFKRRLSPSQRRKPVAP